MKSQTNHLKLPRLSFPSALCLPQKLYQGGAFRKEPQGLWHEKTKRTQSFYTFCAICEILCLRYCGFK